MLIGAYGRIVPTSSIISSDESTNPFNVFIFQEDTTEETWDENLQFYVTVWSSSAEKVRSSYLGRALGKKDVIFRLIFYVMLKVTSPLEIEVECRCFAHLLRCSR